MFRLKVTFGGQVRSRTFDNQAVELFLQCAALNRMIQLAKPESYPVEAEFMGLMGNSCRFSYSCNKAFEKGYLSKIFCLRPNRQPKAA